MATKKKSDKKKVKPINNSKPVVKRGRPPVYSKELAVRICTEIATGVYSVHKICKSNPDFPDPATVFSWLHDNEEFIKLYARAKQMQAEYLRDKMIEAANDDSQDTNILDLPNGPKAVENKEWTSRSKLKVDTYKWLMSKLDSKNYGDKVDVTSGNEKINSAPVVVVATEQAKKLLEDL